ncbi:MAG TPA: hypothetical protein VHU86_00160 [Solirubrobacterales bacterium]|jgi:hypothetical protein|nr:hypothetical protein [Solirubrobacterales bacterium]
MIRRSHTIALLVSLASLLLAPAGAQASFGLEPGSLQTVYENFNGVTGVPLASSHPYAFTVKFKLKTDSEAHSEGGEMRELVSVLPPGFAGNPFALPRCTRQEFEGFTPQCSANTQVGVLRANLPSLGGFLIGPMYNLVPPPGMAGQVGFSLAGNNGLQDFSVITEEGPHHYSLRDEVSFPKEVTAVEATFWGVPADPGHDSLRGDQVGSGHNVPVPFVGPHNAFLTLPAECSAPLAFNGAVASKLSPGVFVTETAYSLDPGGNPAAPLGCASVPFSPKVAAQPTSRSATSSSGLAFELKLPNEGLTSPGGIAETEPQKVEFDLPEGMTANPSFAEGIVTCSEAQYGSEQLNTPAGAGCPEASKLGSVIAHSPLLDEPIEGSLYLAAPYQNKFHSLVAVYMVLRAPERGVMIKQAGEVRPNQNTGQLHTTFEDLPPLPFTDFNLYFREGARAPLATPKACGEYRSNAKLYPFSNPTVPTERSASFQIESGPNAGPCPSGGTPPFHPELRAGSVNNSAGKYSPFDVELSRTDAEQEITHFSIKLPPGVTGKLAGIPFCSDASIAAAKARERTPHGGQEELDHPSCPAASEVGHTLVGAGVGSSLTYVPGKVYLAGPYHGDSLSIVAITAAKAGPFDLGTVVIREGLEINPETAEVFVDATGSDPIPHIVDGIPVDLRDIRVYVDKPNFVLNPTSCEPTSTASTVLGSGTNFISEADDRPVTVTTRYQAADCANLPYKPKFSLKLKGSTKRGGTPALTATLLPRPGDANSKKVSVALPHSEFLDQSHIRTVCTRVQFKAGAGNGAQCPAGSIYGHARAWTPLLSEPLEGPVFLRSSEHPLPDLVLALHGLVDFDAVGRIDSVNGGIRNTFETVPDAPITKVVLEMQGGKKGLLENSTNICKGSHRVTAEFGAQNGKIYDYRPALQAQCGKHKKAAKKHRAKKSHSLRRALDAAF